MYLLKVLTIVFCLMVSCVRMNPNTSFAGVYQSVSESEWAITLSLLSNGKAQLKVETWEAGKYDNRDIEIVDGKWSMGNSQLLLRYKGIADILVYSDELSLSELGIEGGAPGVMQVPPIDEKSIIHGIKLWKKPHEFSK